MHLHLRIRHWVLWWFYVGLACGVIAMVNIFTRDLTRSQDHAILLIGIIFWVLGGTVCWAFEGIEHEPVSVVPARPRSQAATPQPSPAALSPAMKRQWQKLASRGASARVNPRLKRTHHLDQHL